MKTIIIGAGGHSHVIIDTLQLLGYKEIYLVDADLNKTGNKILNSEIIGDDRAILDFDPSQAHLVNGLGSIHLPESRAKVFTEWKEREYNFLTIVHPTAVVSKYAHLKEGCQIMAGAIVLANAVIDENSLINTKASVDHDCKIGKHTHIAPGVTLSGFVEVSHTCLIGTGSSIIQNKKIGECSLIGAGSVVTTDVPCHVKAYGNPARWEQ